MWKGERDGESTRKHEKALPGLPRQRLRIRREGRVRTGRRAGAAAGPRRGNPDRLQERWTARGNGAEREGEGAGAGPLCWAVDLFVTGDAVRIARGAPPPA